MLMESLRRAALNTCGRILRTARTEQSLVPVTYVKDKNKDQYLKGGTKALTANNGLQRQHRVNTHRNQNRARGLKSHTGSSVYVNI